ncbi:hypothetical protein TNCT_428381 [Trichonephila clavata]|uniref:Uncharacterized protein n=1 Tax=Trichonephila clavata TaxID=2740835 RepID=A0A8X6M1Y6_TRICU|nr:hypothetical protein TNCT_428381 [Trichonephila clavata]
MTVSTTMDLKALLFMTLVFFCVSSLLLEAKENSKSKLKKVKEGFTMKDAIKFMEKADERLTEFSQKLSHASFDWSVNVTDANLKELVICIYITS